MDTPALLLIASRQAGIGGNDRTGVRSRSAHAPLLIREQAWELYCETEQLVRLAALQCGCPPATRRTASVPELVRGILNDDKPLLTASDAREWWRDVVEVAGKVNRTYVADRLLDKLAKSEKKGTPKQLSRECAKAGIRLPASTIRTWIHQKRLIPDQHGHVTLSGIVPLLRRRAG